MKANEAPEAYTLGKNLPKVILNTFLLRFLGTKSQPATYNIRLDYILRNKILR